MTVLEKIKRCVSLVWDFQEIYGEEDIEEFCHNELSTYPQHDEIMEYFKHLAELEKENAELKERLKEHETIGNAQFWENVWSWKSKAEQLTKAKEIIRDFISVAIDYIDKEDKNYSYIAEAEQFLKNDGCPNVMCEDCTKEDCGVRQLGLVEVEK